MKGNTGMIDQLKKALITGVGLAVKTWTEVETAGKEIDPQGRALRLRGPARSEGPQGKL